MLSIIHPEFESKNDFKQRKSFFQKDAGTILLEAKKKRLENPNLSQGLIKTIQKDIKSIQISINSSQNVYIFCIKKKDFLLFYLTLTY